MRVGEPIDWDDRSYGPRADGRREYGDGERDGRTGRIYYARERDYADHPARLPHSDAADVVARARALLAGLFSGLLLGLVGCIVAAARTC